MIKWHIMIAVSLGGVIGAELLRRRRNADREVYSFVPPWQHRILIALTIFGCTTFLVSAEAAIRTPTAFHIWILIVSSLATQVSLNLLLNREVHHAKRRLLDKRNI